MTCHLKVLLEPGETVRVLAFYGPWDGLYMFHCHNLIHEDNAMMGAFNVTLLKELGYPETQGFNNPDDARFISKTYTANAFKLTQRKKAVKSLAAMNPYASASKVIAAASAHYQATPCKY
jgi:bilirubin oxidase